MSEIKAALDRNIDFIKLVANEAHYDITLDSSLMPRLKEACIKVSDIKLDIKFYKDLQGLKTLEGTVKTIATLICQRCNKEFDTELVATFKSTSDYEIAKSLRIEDKQDFIELDDNGQFNLYDYLEDCLLLAIPIVPAHDENSPDCERQGTSWSYGKDEVREVDNPFAALKDLKDSFKK